MTTPRPPPATRTRGYDPLLFFTWEVPLPLPRTGSSAFGRQYRGQRLLGRAALEQRHRGGTRGALSGGDCLTGRSWERPLPDDLVRRRTIINERPRGP